MRLVTAAEPPAATAMVLSGLVVVIVATPAAIVFSQPPIGIAAAVAVTGIGVMVAMSSASSP
jgi:hypothetical protein